MSTGGVQNNKTGFWHRVGNWWSRNGQRTGNIIAATGGAATNVAMGGMMLHAMKNDSIFGCGCGMNPFFGGMGMFGGMSPLFGGMSMFGGFGNYGGYGNYGGCSIFNGMYSQIGQQAAFNYGQMQVARYLEAQSQQAELFGNNNFWADQAQANYKKSLEEAKPKEQVELDKADYESTTSADGGDADEGEKIEEGLNSLGSKEEESYTLDMSGNNEYSEKMLTHAKNYLKTMDTDNDNNITKEEYIASQIEDADDTELDEDSKRIVAENAFAKLDRDQDGKLEAEEVASLLHVLDNGQDGKITKNRYSAISQLLGNGEDKRLAKALDKAHNSLFKPQSS